MKANDAVHAEIHAAEDRARKMFGRIDAHMCEFGGSRHVTKSVRTAFPGPLDERRFVRYDVELTTPRAGVEYFYGIEERDSAAVIIIGIILFARYADGSRSLYFEFGRDVYPKTDDRWSFSSNVGWCEQYRAIWDVLVKNALIPRRSLRPPWEARNRLALPTISDVYVRELVGSFIAFANADFDLATKRTVHIPLPVLHISTRAKKATKAAKRRRPTRV
jgi:hypothetical protein